MGKPDGRPWIEVGTNTQVAYVFSCPGYEELLARRPAAKQTRTHLDKVIEHLRRWGPPGVPTSEEATITNAWTRVEYDRSAIGRTGRTEGNEEDLLQPVNLSRLEREIGHITGWVIAFGNRARWALHELKAQNRLRANVAHTRHLTHFSLIHIKTGLDGQTIADLPKGEKRDAQLAVIAAELASQMGQLPEGIRIPEQPVINPYLIHQAAAIAGTNRESLLRVAASVRAALAGQPGSTPIDCQDASTALVMVLEKLGITAWTVRGRISLGQAIPFDEEEPETFSNEPSHWWVESCGYWIDITYHQLRDGLHAEPTSIGIWTSGASVHHIPGVDDPNLANLHEKRLRRSNRMRHVVEQVAKQWTSRS
ncbi:hypothetical protein [Cystobacter fuscus]|uniref:hypothetical protein n=1 Tax=Cystobacter fuscus TaxID=43 RepID=UPI0012DC9F85|nr:hypothetical protein [Cystobacter fuscus]